MNNLILDDCFNAMLSFKDNCVNNILTSPPYNFTTKRKDCYYNNGYSDLDNLSEKEYVEKRINEFKQFERILKPNGTILYNLNYGLEYPHLPIILMNNVIEKTNLTIVDYITWKKPNAIPFQTSPRKLSRICEMVYVIVNKNDVDTYFVNKEISKINDKTKQKFYKNYVNFIEAKNNDKYNTTHKATFSVDFASKLIELYTKENDIIFDPFMGIGTTGISAKSLNRNFIGVEIIEEFFLIAKNRINKSSMEFKSDKNFNLTNYF